MQRVLLTLPAFNEAGNIEPLFLEADRVFRHLNFEGTIVMVDDGSSDGTADIARKVDLETPVHVVAHEQNRGLGQAILTGLRESMERAVSDDDLIVCMDCDNTHPPATIEIMARRAADGCDLVIASRYRRGSRQVGVPPLRRLLSFGARWVFWWKLRLPGVRDYTCGFRAYKVSLIRQGFERYGDELITREGFACTDELLVNLAAFQPKICEVPFVLRYDRKQGASKIRIWKTVRETLRMLGRK